MRKQKKPHKGEKPYKRKEEPDVEEGEPDMEEGEPRDLLLEGQELQVLVLDDLWDHAIPKLATIHV